MFTWEVAMGRREALSRKERRAFDELVRTFYEYEARDPDAGETGPALPRTPPDDPPTRQL